MPKVVILCGGKGTRLREETEFRPKPLVSIGGRPILWHIMKIYAHFGLRQFVLCLGYKGEMIKDYFLRYEAMNSDFTIHLGQGTAIDFHGAHEEEGYAVTLADTGGETQTGGRVRSIAKYVDGDVFLLTYGDGLADVDVARLLEFHRSHGRLATLTTVRPLSRFGVLDLGDNSEVRRFAEKPAENGWISTGFFVFDRRIFDYLDGEDCILERSPLERLSAERQLMAYRHHGWFCAMDTYRECRYLNGLWGRSEAPWKVWK